MAVGPGSVLFVAKDIVHRFHSIEEDLSIFVAFAPPRTQRLSMDWSDVLRAAASFFLVVTGVTLSYVLIRAAHTLDRTSVAIDRTVDEAVPLLEKAGEALDQVSVPARDTPSGSRAPRPTQSRRPSEAPARWWKGSPGR